MLGTLLYGDVGVPQYGDAGVPRTQFLLLLLTLVEWWGLNIWVMVIEWLCFFGQGLYVS